MHSRTPLRLAAYAGLAFLHLPLLFIALQAFNDMDGGDSFPVTGLTLRWAMAIGTMTRCPRRAP